jgi:hypothetical protein
MNYDEVYDMEAIVEDVEEEEEEDDEYNERNMNALIDSLFKDSEKTLSSIDTIKNDLLFPIPDKENATSPSANNTKVEEPMKPDLKVETDNVPSLKKRFQLRTIPLFMKL